MVIILQKIIKCIMKRQINIFGPTYKYKYLIEYNKSIVKTDADDIHWCKDGNEIRLFTDDVKYYRKYNDWYKRETIYANFDNKYVPNSAHITNIKFYIPNFAPHLHLNGIKYMLSFNTWINGVRIDLGSYFFRPTDSFAIKDGTIKQGNTEYFEYVSLNILDPYYLMYSDDWAEFRNKVCLEPKNINSTPSSLYATLYVVNEYENRFIQNPDFIGSCTNFIVADYDDSLRVGLNVIQEPKLGFRFDVNMNPEYDWLLTYFKETYNLDITANEITFDLIIRKENSVIAGPSVKCTLSSANSTNGRYFQDVYWDSSGLESFKLFFSSWNDFEDGWYFVGTMTITNLLKEDGEVYEEYDAQIFLTNDVIITQEIYSMFSDGGSEKINMDNLIVPRYNIVNKLKHEITSVNRPSTEISSLNDNSFNLPARLRRPDKFNIHKTFTRPLIKCNI